MSIDPGRIFAIRSEREFEELALEIFDIQAAAIPVYREFIRHTGIQKAGITDFSGIPFLPAEFFKSHEIMMPGRESQHVFESSGTTGSTPSRHLIADISLYERSLLEGFRYFYGSPENFCILALMPSYHEKPRSSLAFMLEKLIRSSKDPDSGFYLHDPPKLIRVLEEKRSAGTPVILAGISFALAELAEQYPMDIPGMIIMETGGMKGRRREMVRAELHKLIKENFGTGSVHSEYGMTELLSQAYSKKDGIFYAPPWMRVIVRDLHDPFKILKPYETGIVNIIDLANLYSCSFVASSDLGRVFPDGSFEILGRADHSDLRGCSLMISG